MTSIYTCIHVLSDSKTKIAKKILARLKGIDRLLKKAKCRNLKSSEQFKSSDNLRIPDLYNIALYAQRLGRATNSSGE
jgi:hypothetical protein